MESQAVPKGRLAAQVYADESATHAVTSMVAEDSGHPITML